MIQVAKSAGYCFGVSRALDMVEKGAQSGERIVTLGPIIHNKRVVESLHKRGVESVDSIDEIPAGATVVIRSHGVPKETEDILKSRGIKYIDATCPFVKKIHNIVRENYLAGKQIVIIGDKEHPEVWGINGWCDYSAIIISTNEDAENAIFPDIPICVVSQTTFERKLWEIFLKTIKNACKVVVSFDTICSATNERQEEAAALAAQSDVFVVVGGSMSSNTKKLFDIARAICPNTYFAEDAESLPNGIAQRGARIGITAGASTPDWIIKEVCNIMQEEEKNIASATTNQGNGELTFAEELEQSLVTLNTGQVVNGTVIGITPTEVYVNLGYKADGIIPVEELTGDPDVDPASVVSIGDKVTVFVVRVNDVEGYVKLSKKKIDALKGWQEIENANGTDTVFDGKVLEAVNKGIIVLTNGCRVFVPASQANDRFLSDLSSLVGNNVRLRIIDIREDRRGKKAIGSIKSVMSEERERKSSEFWNGVEVGKHYSGVVKTITAFGVFVDIGGVDGLVHISELSWSRIKSPSEVVNVGDVIDVYIIDANKETGKISLGYRKPEDNPWSKAQAQFNVGDVVNVKVVRLCAFGAFVELIKGVDGLIHVSKIANERVAKPDDVLKVGQFVEAKITDTDWDNKKIGLSMKARMWTSTE
ncbi:MAG: bifunctional 4-hydroxy-3-methylbut-2-enyl diphosphate reductase/30S ribosomal protein S1 [Clostridia bacterium]|nr:bifunctional 4-hydroxy-3-methylbut-2-enyl diphosphate reductase/30S ribosomal protein S1 [Clostridia bacterium]